MKSNRKRKHQIALRLNDAEMNHLNTNARKTGMNREAYLRMLILGSVPAEKPNEDFLEVIKQLRHIGNNINQLVMIAHKTGSIDILKFKQANEQLNDSIMEIRRKVYLPTHIDHGNNSDMGC